MSKRRGKRVVVGYVVSLSGKRGGPWESVGPNPTQNVVGRLLFAPEHKRQAVENAKWWRDHPHHGHPNARALPLVRYEVDAEEERLRDAVVEAADVVQKARKRLDDHPRGACSGATGCHTYPEKLDALFAAVLALRAHREKVGR